MVRLLIYSGANVITANEDKKVQLFMGGREGGGCKRKILVAQFLNGDASL